MRVNFELKQTDDYRIFKKVVNRDVNSSRVSKLAKSIAENGLQVPILVTKEGKVVDGQHRLAALESLNYPVPYLISTVWRNNEHTAVINNSQQSWNAIDWAKFRAKEGNKEIKAALSLAEMFVNVASKPMTINTALELIQSDVKARLVSSLKNNTYKYDRVRAANIFKVLQIMSNYPSSTNPFSQKMVRAMKALYVKRDGLNKKAIERMCADNYEFHIYNNEGQMAKYLEDLYKKYLVKSRV